MVSENVKKINRIFSDPAETKAQVIHCTREAEAGIFSSLPFIANITEAFLGALNVPDWIYSYQNFNFPKKIPGHSYNFSVQVTLLTPSVGFLFVFVFIQDFLVHPFRPPGVFSWLSPFWDELIPSLEEVILED